MNFFELLFLYEHMFKETLVDQSHGKSFNNSHYRESLS